MYYVYAHINATNGSYFYIGKGSGRRAYVKSHRSVYWKRIVAKYGYAVIILEDGLTESEALSREKYWIKKLGRKDLKTGCLVNFTDGGDGTSGRVVEEKVRIAVAEANKKRVASDINRTKTGSLFKGKFGEDHNRSKAVKCVESGEVFGSMSEAGRKLNICPSSVHWSIKHKKPIYEMHFEIAN